MKKNKKKLFHSFKILVDSSSLPLLPRPSPIVANFHSPDEWILFEGQVSAWRALGCQEIVASDFQEDLISLQC